MKNIFRILLLAFIVPFFMQSCRDDDFATQTAEPSFKLYNTTSSANVLYPTMKDNPFRLTWDNTLGAATEYTVQLSATEDFATPVTLGKTTGNTYSTTIGALNTALLQAGYAPYTAKTVYMRVISGSYTSNVISFNATPYPSTAPVITTPTAGTKIALDGANPDAIASKITWTDYSYGTTVVYKVEMAQKGSTNFVTLGTVNNLKQLDVTNLVMDQAVLKLGGKADVAADYDLRVTATTTSTGGTINSTSSVVTVNVTPYQLESYMYALGGFNDWSHDTAEILTSATSNGIYEGYINFPAAGTEFKITEQRNWNVNYGDDGADGILDANGANIKSPGAGYHKVVVDMNTKTITVIPQVWGIIGAATPGGWTTDTAMVWNGATKTWEVTLPLTVGDFKFRRDSNWDVNYGDSGKDGILDNGGDNIPVTVAGTYKVIFDEPNLTYKLILQ